MPAAKRLLARLRRTRVVRLDAETAYTRWAPVYPARAHNAVMAAEADALRPLVLGCRAGRALDVGTGTGRNLALLRRTGAGLVAGVDLSAAMLGHAERGAVLVRANAMQLPFADGTFDLVTSSLMCGDIEDLAGWLAEASRVLRPGGSLIYSDFHPSWGEQGWTRTFTGDDGRTYQLPLHPHTLAQHLGVLGGAGMKVGSVVTPCATAHPLPILTVIHAVREDGGEA